MSQASLSRLAPDIYMKRALGFIRDVESKSEIFREQVIQYQNKAESNESFLKVVKGTLGIRHEKAGLFNDLHFADQQLDQAVAIDQSAEIETEYGVLNARSLRSRIIFMRGQIEMIWGSRDSAIQLFNDCISILETPDAHYMLGLVYEDKYLPREALQHFEKYLELEPNGDLSVSALREASAMRNYKKRFRGNWGTFAMLLFVWPIAIIYFFVKRK